MVLKPAIRIKSSLVSKIQKVRNQTGLRTFCIFYGDIEKSLPVAF